MKIVIAFLAASFLSAIGIAPASYSAKPIEATVVDGKTGQPISGAIVIAQWVLEDPNNGHHVGVLKAAEAITDPHGVFKIPGWGPIARPGAGVLFGRDPELFVFKDGFSANLFSNEDAAGSRARLVERDSVWNGRSLALKTRAESERQYRQDFGLAFGRIADLFLGEGCHWKALPKTTKVLLVERKRLIAAGSNDSVIPPLPILLDQRQCGPFEEYLRQHEAK